MKKLSYLLLALFTGLSYSSITQHSIIADYKNADLFDVIPYIDSLVIDEMNISHVPGAILVVVQDSQEAYVQGYGYADVENQKKVDPNRTGFRIASVTKTFTATAILQLAQQGLIDLHVPVSRYLPDDRFTFLEDEPFTVHQLLTHTAGIDFTDIGDAAIRPEDVVPLETFVRNHIPDIVHKPGSVHSYSNFGYTILGYIIQHISGISYEEYILKHILEPLDMNSSSMTQPLGEPFRSNLSNGHKLDDGFVSIPRDYTNTVPGGGLISTAHDMSRYLMMHLQGGELDSAVILNPEYHYLLTTQQYGSKNTKYGICYSFLENGWTGRRSLEHTGGQLGFLSLFVLIPETGTGLFIAQNIRENAGGFRYDVATAILDTLLHRKERHIDLPPPSSSLDAIASRYTGRYQQMNYSHSSFEKLGVLFGYFDATYDVKYSGNGLLTINDEDYVMVSDNLFHENDESSPWNLEFIMEDNGQAGSIRSGTTSYKRTPWYVSTAFWRILFGTGFALILIHLLRFPFIWIVRKVKKREATIRQKDPYTLCLNLSAGLLISGLIGIAIHLTVYGGQLADYGVPLTFKLTLLLNTAGAVIALFFPVVLINWWRRKANLYSKIWTSLIVLASVMVVAVYWHYNVIGFHY